MQKSNFQIGRLYFGQINWKNHIIMLNSFCTKFREIKNSVRIFFEISKMMMKSSFLTLCIIKCKRFEFQEMETKYKFNLKKIYIEKLFTIIN